MVEFVLDVLDVREPGGRRLCRLGQRIDLDLLGVGHGLRHVGRAVALEVRTEERVAAPRSGPQRLVVVGNGAVVDGRQHQELGARALVDPEEARVLERDLPDVDDVGVQRAIRAGGRDLDHDRAHVLRAEEAHEIERVGVRRERLVMPVERTAPVDDLVHLAGRLGQHLLEHQVVVDHGHAPDRSLDPATGDGGEGGNLASGWPDRSSGFTCAWRGGRLGHGPLSLRGVGRANSGAAAA